MVRKRYPMVRVEWDDITGYSRWTDVGEAVARGFSRITTLGYLLHSSRGKVVVAGALDGEGRCTDTTNIPRAVVRRIDRLDAAPKGDKC